MVRLVVLVLAACAGEDTPKTTHSSASSPETSPLAAPATDQPDSGSHTGSHTGSDPGPGAAARVIRGAVVLGAGPCSEAPCDVRIVDGEILAVGPPGSLTAAGDTETALGGGFLVPAFIDSHVHFSYRSGAEQMADGGVAAAVDLAAPREALTEAAGPIPVIRSGPMLTAVAGYPTQGWGRGGYGWELDSPEEAAAAVAALAAEGAGLIKVPVGEDGPAEEILAAIGTAAAGAGLPLAAHALNDSEARVAAAAGATVLAHTPVQPLGPATVADWSDKAVITTLAAFGGSDTTVANLRALHAAGTTLLYGTDYGNTRTAGIDGAELALLEAAGLDGRQIINAGTASPAAFWGIDTLGSIAPGKRASMLWLAADPRLFPQELARPGRVWIDGLER